MNGTSANFALPPVQNMHSNYTKYNYTNLTKNKIMQKIQKPTPNFLKGRGGYSPELIVLHIMAGSLAGTDEWFANPASKVSSHYGVGLAGEVHQYVEDHDTAWAQGRVDNPTFKLFKGVAVNPNKYCLSIEHEGQDLSKGPEAQLDASVALILELCTKWSIPIDRDHIIGHYQVYSLKPNCPATDKGIIDTIITKVEALKNSQEKNTMSNEKGAYKFTNKETGEVKYGILHTAGEGFDIFRTVDNQDIRVENVDGRGDNPTSELYNVEFDAEYAGPFPTWEAK